MKAALTIRLSQHRFGVDVERMVEIDGPFLEAFEPVDRVDDPFTAYVVGGKNIGEMRSVTKMREGYAKFLAEQIAAELVAVMESRDLKNGHAPQTQTRKQGTA